MSARIVKFNNYLIDIEPRVYLRARLANAELTSFPILPTHISGASSRWGTDGEPMGRGRPGGGKRIRVGPLNICFDLFIR